jgi:hypothetical protein
MPSAKTELLLLPRNTLANTRDGVVCAPPVADSAYPRGVLDALPDLARNSGIVPSRAQSTRADRWPRVMSGHEYEHARLGCRPLLALPKLDISLRLHEDGY